MTRTEEFRQGYAPVVDSLDLPDRIALVYRPEACLAERQDRSVWRLRRRCDEAPFVLKIARADGEDLEEEFRLLSQLYPALAGHVPLVRLSLGWRAVSDGDWSVLGTLPLLEELSLWGPPEEAVAALCERDQLPILNVGLLPCEDLSILAGCQVVDLRLHTGQVSLEGAGELPRLRNLGLFSSKVTDLSPWPRPTCWRPSASTAPPSPTSLPWRVFPGSIWCWCPSP